jgi:imidazolonepropionase-like amidohydrolase
MSLKQRGVDFVKVYSMLSREAYFGIADEARRQGLPYAGHVPPSVTAAEASDAGQKSIEHLTGVFEACAGNEAELLNETRMAIGKSDFAAFSRALLQAELRSLDTYDERKAAALFARFVKNGTWQVPTIVRLRGILIDDGAVFTGDPRLKYIPVETREDSKAQRAGLLKNLPPELADNRQRFFQRVLDLTGAMHRSGVELMAGTDPAGMVLPGFSLHDELVLLVKAGFTPLEALQAATRQPARYSGMLDRLGTVEKGKIADLVLLDANPLEDISNTQKIAAVVVGGKLIPRSELQSMLATVEEASKRH